MCFRLTFVDVAARRVHAGCAGTLIALIARARIASPGVDALSVCGRCAQVGALLAFIDVPARFVRLCRGDVFFRVAGAARTSEAARKVLARGVCNGAAAAWRWRTLVYICVEKPNKKKL